MNNTVFINVMPLSMLSSYNSWGDHQMTQEKKNCYLPSCRPLGLPWISCYLDQLFSWSKSMETEGKLWGGVKGIGSWHAQLPLSFSLPSSLPDPKLPLILSPSALPTINSSSSASVTHCPACVASSCLQFSSAQWQHMFCSTAPALIVATGRSATLSSL